MLAAYCIDSYLFYFFAAATNDSVNSSLFCLHSNLSCGASEPMHVICLFTYFVTVCLTHASDVLEPFAFIAALA
jgi:hypothetical protein